MAKRCYGCMKKKESSPICEHCGFDENKRNHSHQLPMGTVLGGQYLLGKVVHQDDSHIAYLGWDQYMNKQVAVKEYFPKGHCSRDNHKNTTVAEKDDGYDYGGNMNLFLREETFLAKLYDHANAVQIQRGLVENGTAYVVTEAPQGRTLRRHMEKLDRPLDIEEVLDTLGPVILAVTELHKEGIFHCNLNPDSVILLPDGSVKLKDFGAALTLDEAVMLSRPGTLVVPCDGYAAPEMYGGKELPGPWTDVYSLCALIHYCMTGEPPLSAQIRKEGNKSVDWYKIRSLPGWQRQELDKGIEVLRSLRTNTAAELYMNLFQDMLLLRALGDAARDANSKRG